MNTTHKKVELALLQMSTDIDKQENLQKAEDLVTLAAGRGADIVMLPEMFTIPYLTEYMQSSMEPIDGEIITTLRKVASDNDVNILAGSFPEKASSERCYNTSVFIDRNGEILAAHRKVHLFDVNFGELSVQESEVVLPGENATVFETEFGRAGIAICYDVRFPELFFKMLRQGAEIIFLPGAFNTVSGPPHWELLIRGRALDCQVYMAACSPASSPDLPYDPWGHSMLVDPWGKIVVEAGRGEDIIYSSMDMEYVQQVRSQLPLTLHRRDSVY